MPELKNQSGSIFVYATEFNLRYSIQFDANTLFPPVRYCGHYSRYKYKLNYRLF